MTVDEIRLQVALVGSLVNDPEIAHSLERNLWESVLQAIGDGHAVDPCACAKTALETLDVEFCRWFA